MRAPYRQKNSGHAHITSAMKARRELPHPKPRASYMEGPAKGNKAPTSDRRPVLAAVTEAA